MAELVSTEAHVVDPKPFDSAKFMADRNSADRARLAGKELPKVEAKPDPKPEAAVDDETATLETHAPKLPRSVRRELNKLREDKARAEGRLAAYEELGARPKLDEKPVEKPHADDPEPQRAQYATDAEHNRSLGRWDARQEAAKLLDKEKATVTETAKLDSYREHLTAMDTKAEADKKLLPEWDATIKADADNEDSIKFSPDDHMNLMGLIGSSDVKAFVLYHFAKNQADLQKFLDLSADPSKQIREFHRLEGRIEKLYTPEVKAEVKAAQAGSESSKDRSNPADGQEPGRTAADRDVRKPKPSAEVAARGGSAPPLEPAIGSREWMHRRNQAQYAR